MSTEAHIATHPGIRGGAPCVAGTRIDVETIARIVWGEGGSIALALASYPHLNRQQVILACWHQAMYGAAIWGRRWGAWAVNHEPAMRADDYDEIPDPPTA